MFGSTSTSLIVRGVVAIVIGIIAAVWPGVTILALVLLFAVYAFTDAVFEGARAFAGQRVWPVLGHLLLALIDVAAGLVAVVWPAPTALVLTLIVGIWAIATGMFGITAAFLRGEGAGTRAMFIVTGLLSIAFGAIVVDRPVAGALTIALLFGLFSIASGVTAIMQGDQLRRIGNTLRPVDEMSSDVPAGRR
jgi:uncharacterized membrane protein HdeD (DUF308 family)